MRILIAAESSAARIVPAGSVAYRCTGAQPSASEPEIRAQAHVDPSMKIEYRALLLKALPGE